MMKKIGIVFMALACFELVYAPLLKNIRLPSYEGNAEGFVFKPWLNFYSEAYAQGLEELMTPQGCAAKKGKEWNTELGRCVNKKTVDDANTAGISCKEKSGNDYISCMRDQLKAQCEANAKGDKAKMDACTNNDIFNLASSKDDANAILAMDIATGVIFLALLVWFSIQAANGYNMCSSSFLIMLSGFLVLVLGELVAYIGLKMSADGIKNGFYNTRFVHGAVVKDSKNPNSGYGRDSVGYAMAQTQTAAYEAMQKLQEAYLGYLQTRQGTYYAAGAIFGVAASFALVEAVAKSLGTDKYDFNTGAKDKEGKSIVKTEIADELTEDEQEAVNQEAESGVDNKDITFREGNKDAAAFGKATEKLGCTYLGDSADSQNNVTGAIGWSMLLVWSVTTFGLNLFGNVENAGFDKTTSVKKINLQQLKLVGEHRRNLKILKASVHNLKQSDDLASSYTSWKDFINYTGGATQSMPYTYYEKLAALGFTEKSDHLGEYAAVVAENFVAKIQQ